MTADQFLSMAGSVIVVLGFLAAIVAWLFKTGIAPLKVVIENNTTALNLALATLGKHEEELKDHDTRINTIETIHDVLGCAKK